jgi:hypothetical protein
VKHESDNSVTKTFLDSVPPYCQVLIPLSSRGNAPFLDLIFLFGFDKVWGLVCLTPLSAERGRSP